MNFLDNSLLTVLLTLAATFLGLSIVVQVVQELYKYLRSSKSRAYLISLQDFLGPLAQELLRPGVLPDIRIRGPMQLKRVRSKGMVLPFKQDELASALERTAPPWIQRTLEHLNMEAKFQKDKPLPPSASWEKFLKELGNSEKGAIGYWNAFEIAEFLKEWEYDWQQETLKDNSEIKRIGTLTFKNTTLDAKQLLTAFRKKFLSYVENANQNFSKFEKNFEYTYTRANRRQTFIIAILITIIFNLPIDLLYRNAQQVDSEAAIKFAETTLEIYQTQKDTILIKEDVEMAKEIMRNTLTLQKAKQNTKYLINFAAIPDPLAGDFKFFIYLLYCLITAVLITFGAPFWNDIASALLRLQKGKSSEKSSPSTEVDHG